MRMTAPRLRDPSATTAERKPAVSELIKRLQERRLNAWEQAKEIAERAAEESRDMTAEERQSWDNANTDIDAIDARVKQLVEGEQRAKDAEEAFRAILDKPEDRTAPHPSDGPSADLRSFLKGDGGRSFEVRAGRPVGTEEFRTLSKLTAGAGANTVKTSFYDQLVAHLIEVSGILNAGPTVLNTSTGEQIQVPKTTAHSTAALTTEAASISASDPTFGQVPLDAYKYALLLQVSNELVNDTSVDLEGYIAMQAGRAVGNAFGAHAITGTGTNQPNGVVTAATLGVTGGTGVTGAFTADNLIDLFFSVIAPYRNSKSCGWLMKDATLASVRKLKDTTNQYLWQPSIQVGVPDTLLGKPVYTDPNVAAPALSAKSVVFGDFSQYFVRMVDGVRFERSDDFAFGSDLVTYRCVLRADGDLVDVTGAVKYFQGAGT
jgi:HK97 family phage major capsid protein